MMKFHKKPTTAFGTLSFSKDGKVSRQITVLSEHKAIQEQEAINIFADQFNVINPDRQILDIKTLPENDHDFVIKTSDKEIFIQLTELTNHEYYIKITKEQYDSGKWTSFAIKEGESIPHAIDKEKMNYALQKLVKKKVEKNYSKGKQEIWLVIFTTDTGYLTEYVENKERKISDALRLTREYLKELGTSTFSEIWFTNLESAPIKV